MVCPSFNCESGAGVTRVVSKGSNTAAGFVLQEFEVEKGTTAAGETREDFLPAALVFVAVGELDMGMLEREGFFGQFFEADDDVV